MKKQRLLLFLLIVMLATILGVRAQLVVQALNFAPLSGGYIPTATDWTNQLTSIYTWMNTNVVTPLNSLTTKGDLYQYTNGGLGRLAVGSNTQVLTSDGTNLVWGAATSQDIGARTKGTLISSDGSTAQYIAPGSNTLILTVDSTQPSGLAWSNAQIQVFPKGAIFPWSPSKAGTNTIPTGFALCDGSGGTPNLIGMFVVGSRPTGSSSSPAVGGFGVEPPGLGNGHTTHLHNAAFVQNNGTTSGANGSSVIVGVGAQVNGDYGHPITFNSINTNTGTLEPADWALCYIMKL